jgi:hypothetical protein
MSIRSLHENSLAIGEAFFGEEHQGDHDQGHVMMPGIETPDLVVGQTAGALGILEPALDEMACCLHFGQMTQTGLWLGIGYAELQLRAVEFASNQQMPVTCLRLLSVPQPDRVGKVLRDHIAFLPLTHRKPAPMRRRLHRGPVRHRQNVF